MLSSSAKPSQKPTRPFFSSGPCAKFPGWSADQIATDSLGRSHRSSLGKARISALVDKTRAILGVPDSHRIGIMPASDTGAFEAAMWSLLGPRPVTALSWESFGEGWVTDILKQLKLDATILRAPYGALPDLSAVDCANDIVFTWNGTTSGVRVPNGDWITEDREGLTLCDATSAVFAQDLPWDKLDVVTYSWQKVMGGEAQHGMMVLGPRAVERLESHTPSWPLPKLFRLTKKGQLNAGIFEASTINTPSMLCVEDHLLGLAWGQSVGGLKGLQSRANENLATIEAWVASSPWAEFLASDAAVRSNTSVCLSIVDGDFSALPEKEQRAFVKRMEKSLAAEDVGFDFGGYRDAPPGLRIWCGATVDASDIAMLLPWLDWAFENEKAALAA